MKKTLLLFFFFLVFAFEVFAQKSEGGSQDLGGGNSYEAEAKLIMDYSIRNLIENFEGHLIKHKININNFKNTIYNTIIFSCPTLPRLKGFIERDAIWQKIKDFKSISIEEDCRDDLKKLIILNPEAEYLIFLKRSAWAKMNDLQKRILIIHEALGISKHDDSAYQLSSKLAMIFQTTLIPPKAKQNIFHEVRFGETWTPGENIKEQIYPWNVDDEPPKDSVDGIFQFIRFNWADRNLYWTRTQADPRFETDHIYFYLRDREVDYFSADEWHRSRKCESYLKSHKPINFIVVGEFNQTIIDCGLR